MQSSGKWAAESAGIWADLVHLRPRHVPAHKRTRISIYHMIRHMYADTSARPNDIELPRLDLPKLPKNPQGLAVADARVDGRRCAPAARVVVQPDLCSVPCPAAVVARHPHTALCAVRLRRAALRNHDQPSIVRVRLLASRSIGLWMHRKSRIESSTDMRKSQALKLSNQRWPKRDSRPNDHGNSNSKRGRGCVTLSLRCATQASAGVSYSTGSAERGLGSSCAATRKRATDG